MKWQSTPVGYSLTLSALIREILSEHPEDPQLVPLRMSALDLTSALPAPDRHSSQHDTPRSGRHRGR